jgi:hypothetical protein
MLICGAPHFTIGPLFGHKSGRTYIIEMLFSLILTLIHYLFMAINNAKLGLKVGHQRQKIGHI